MNTSHSMRFPLLAGWIASVFTLAACSEGGSYTLSDPSTPAAEKDQPAMADTTQAANSVLDHTIDSLAGEAVDLNAYKGQVVLIVNTASKCGFTGQYEGLESLYNTYKDQGLVVLGFPANNFGSQEPGSDSEIAQFCQANYGVSFPMFTKISVTGDEVHPLYQQLAAQDAPIGGPPKWNFTKFLLDRNGAPVARFESAVDPVSEQVTAAVEHYLGS